MAGPRPTWRGAARGAGPAAVVLAGLLALAGPAQAAQTKIPEGFDLGAGAPAPGVAQLRALYADRTVAVVGEEVITERDVVVYIGRGNLKEDPAQIYPDAAPAELEGLRFEAALSEIIDDRLKTVGGRNLGFEPELIARAVDDQVEGFIRRSGGEQRAASSFLRMGITKAQLRSIYEQRMLGSSWEATVTGRGPGATGRNVVDSYIRPGKQYARYQELNASREPEDMAKIGKSPGALTLRQLPVMVRGGLVGEDQARRNLEVVRQNVVNGTITYDEAMSRIAPEQFRGEQGYVRDIPPAALAALLVQQHPDGGAALAEFTTDPAPGDISPVLPIVRQGAVQAFTIYRVEALEGPKEAAPFVDRELQQQLNVALAEEWDDVQVFRAIARLARTTHVTPAEVKTWLLQRGRVQARRSPGQGEAAGQGGRGGSQGAPAGARGAGPNGSGR
ncbi:MAG: hypothetical protein VX460_06900 [Planctomycetota bacterium]|nr:hypothetical protein [Planctomycetota bacterium]